MNEGQYKSELAMNRQVSELGIAVAKCF